MLNKQETLQAMLDNTVTHQEMIEYGYDWGGMMPIGKDRALELHNSSEVYKLYEDGSESLVYEEIEIKEHNGLFGLHREDAYRVLNKQKNNI
ncbi:hypothetical protein F892_00013 [Acinetobacter vivianii]|uniref:Uncharacterized protein n=1 Tax=Acinetobacter vivianii TaxID=1776742 RepID=N9NUW1_9GAMM|nr:hypothetical protein [Acinetobacter vivianii]ENX24863.1 hypothetical protein F892_00013 [Acinetobacter vivianii]GGI62124.1 hypothetical protein GCM10011446_36190 [Acinetobacter vivianii]